MQDQEISLQDESYIIELSILLSSILDEETPGIGEPSGVGMHLAYIATALGKIDSADLSREDMESVNSRLKELMDKCTDEVQGVLSGIDIDAPPAVKEVCAEIEQLTMDASESYLDAISCMKQFLDTKEKSLLEQAGMFVHQGDAMMDLLNERAVNLGQGLGIEELTEIE